MIITQLDSDQIQAMMVKAVKDGLTPLATIYTNFTSKQQHSVEKFLTKQEAADLAGVSVSTIANWARAKKINKYKFGESVRIKYSELLAYLESCKV